MVVGETNTSSGPAIPSNRTSDRFAEHIGHTLGATFALICPARIPLCPPASRLRLRRRVFGGKGRSRIVRRWLPE